MPMARPPNFRQEARVAIPTWTCYRCAKNGHIVKNCWEKESNAHQSKTIRMEIIHRNWSCQCWCQGGGDNQVEFLLCGLPMTFPGDSAPLNDSNVWIGDTGATTQQFQT
jgi:hypothetical protein